MFARLVFFLVALGVSSAAAQEPLSYVGSVTCAGCHQPETASWRESHHALAWTEATAGNVVADFDGTGFTGAGMNVAFSASGTGFHAAVTEADGRTTQYDIHSVIGIAPLQQYLIETAPGRLQSFDLAWDNDRGEWFHLYPDRPLSPQDGLHWTGVYKNWNSRCAECHATGFRKNYDPATRRYGSTQAEIGVGCEACHGPASAHLEWAETEQPPLRPDLDIYGFTMFGDAGAEGWIQQCAGCHSRREAFGDGNPLPGTPYHDAYRLALLTPDLYFPDGQIREEVYVYGSFLQSKMYEKGVSCTNCHDPHAARLKAEGNAVCTQCHSPAGNPDFPGLPLKVFDGPEHSFHPEGSAGAECRACHMAERTYMGIDDRADHSFRIPRPDLSATTGAPDACTSCHSDRTADWAARKLAEWYPDSTRRGPHFGTDFALAATDAAAALPRLLRIARNEDAADIVRATALYLMQPAIDDSGRTEAAPLLQDDSPLVRAATARLYRTAPAQQKVRDLIGLLDDPVRLVRLSVAPDLLNAPIARLPQALDEALRSTMTEWRQSLANRTDFPETHLVLGGTALTMRNFPAALAAFREAVAQDPQLVQAWVMIVRLDAAMRGPATARASLAEALAANPGHPALMHLQRELPGE